MTTMATPARVQSEPRLGARVRIGQSILTVILAVCALVALSTVFVEDPFEPAAVVLIASFGVLAAVLGIATVWGAIRSRAVRIAVWALPLFFVSHVAALGTWMPDGVFAIVSAIGAALVASPERPRGARD